MESDTRNPGSSTPQGRPVPPVFEEEFQALAEMIGYDMPEVMVDLLDTYLEESAGLVESITTLSRTEPGSQTLLRAAHSLKSSSASIGAMPLSGLCASLENYLRGGGEQLDVPMQVEQIETEFGRVREDLAARRETLLNT